jgi:hypothetical protein
VLLVWVSNAVVVWPVQLFANQDLHALVKVWVVLVRVFKLLYHRHLQLFQLEWLLV